MHRYKARPVLSPNMTAKLAEMAPTGEIVSPAVIQSWVDLTWPVMLEYHPRGVTSRIITSWWSRVRPDELERARRRLNALQEKAETDELLELQDRLNAAPATVERGSLFAATVKR